MFVMSAAVLAPLFLWYQSREAELARNRLQLLRLEEMLHTLPLYRHELAGQISSATNQRIFLAGDSDAAAAANLQMAIKTLASANGADLLDTSVLPSFPSTGVRQISISVDLTATWPALINLLASIDCAHPRMAVGDLGVTSVSGSNAVLQISFTLSAYRTGGSLY